MKMCSRYKSTITRACIFIVSLLLLTLVSYSRAEAQYAAVQVINTSGGGTVNLTVKNVSDNQTAAQGNIAWSNAQAGSGTWKLADQYIEISQTNLPVLWGMQIYTDNTNSSASPRYTGTGDPAGLVKASNAIMALPMVWRITDHVLTVAERTNPVERADATGFSDYLWHYLKDKNTPDKPYTPVNETFVNGSEYVTAWNQAGIAWNEGARARNPKKAYIYFAANFKMAAVNAQYNTSKLILEAYHEGVSPFPLYLYRDYNSLENHFAPSGFMNYSASSPHMTVNSNSTEVTSYSGTSCLKITWNGQPGADTYLWGGVMWLEPETIWDTGGTSTTHNGYDLRGIDYITFWARTDTANQGLQIKAWYGNSWDSCGQSFASWLTPSLTTAWQQYLITKETGDNMYNVTGGLGIVFANDHDPNPDGCPIYIDEIKYGKY